MAARPVRQTRLGDIYRRLLDELWKIEIRAAGVEVRPSVRLRGRPIVDLHGDSVVTVGDRCVLVSRSRDTALGVSRPVILRTLRAGARVSIGSDVGLSGTTICASSAILIGDRVLCGSDVLIADTAFHAIDSIPRRYAPPPDPVESDRIVIGDDVFIGARVVVLAGSAIGEGSVIGAGSVVKGQVPPNVVAAGNPCRVLRTLSVADS